MSLTTRLTFPVRSSVRDRHRLQKGRRGKAQLAIEVLETRTLLSVNLGVGPNVLVNPKGGNQSETSIASNPTNPSNVFAIANDPTSTLLFANYSMDGGTTWTPSSVAGLPGTWGDAQTAWDSFGNLFVTYLSSSLTAVVTVLSSDGGQTFSVINTTTTGGLIDQPSIAVGPSNFGDGTGSVWVSYESFSANAGQGGIAVKGAVVTGLGNVTSFVAARMVPGSSELVAQSGPGNFGNIAVGPRGQVLVAYELPSFTVGPAGLYVNLDAGGFSGEFGAPVLITTTNVGGFAPLTPQPNRSTDAEVSVAYDTSGGPHTGRVYVVYTDRASVSDMNDTDIYARYSDDDGLVWSDRVLVNDDGHTGKAQFNPAIAVDQSSGNSTAGFLAVTWYDGRTSPLNNSAAVWGTISIDGGQSFLPNVQISTGLINAHASDPGFEFGDYDTMDFNNGTLFRSWTDNILPGHSELDLATAPATVLFGDVPASQTHRDAEKGSLAAPLPGRRTELLSAGREISAPAASRPLSTGPFFPGVSLSLRAATGVSAATPLATVLPPLLEGAGVDRFFTSVLARGHEVRSLLFGEASARPLPVRLGSALDDDEAAFDGSCPLAAEEALARACTEDHSQRLR